jgi:hypothetical protein
MQNIRLFLKGLRKPEWEPYTVMHNQKTASHNANMYMHTKIKTSHKKRKEHGTNLHPIQDHNEPIATRVYPGFFE